MMGVRYVQVEPGAVVVLWMKQAVRKLSTYGSLLFAIVPSIAHCSLSIMHCSSSSLSIALRHPIQQQEP